MNSIWALALVMGAEPARSVDFATEVVPVLTRAGCNAGACHGAAAGRGGLHLSLFGSDPVADHEALVNELKGRRVNLAHPDKSLVLRKPTGMMKHGGGERLDADGPGAKRLRDWIAGGAKLSNPSRKLTQFDVQPGEAAIQLGVTVPLRSRARFDQGEHEDVTDWTVFTPTDASAVEIDDAGKATVRRPGKHVVIARFLDRVVAVRLMVPFPGPPAARLATAPSNFIDQEIQQLAARLNLPMAAPASDVEFARRVWLDLTGRLPTPEQLKEFLEKNVANRREELVDRLLGGQEFQAYWTFRLVRQLGHRGLPGEAAGAYAFHQWIHDHVKSPWHEVAASLLTGQGDSHENGPAWFARMGGDARGQAELVSSAFLGVKLQCANCHNHPLGRWTQDDYHGLAAIFAKVENGRMVRRALRGTVTHPKTGEAAAPRLPGVRSLPDDVDGRRELAAWLTAPNNPYFAKAQVNRLWAAMLGRGLVEPVDDMRETNPASHPALLDKLAADFVEHGYDLRHTLRIIALSQTYGRTTGRPIDDRYFTHALIRPLAPELLVDAWCDVTGVPEVYAGETYRTRAIELARPEMPAPTLDALGRCGRPTGCTDAPGTGSLPALLHRLNGAALNKKLTDPSGRLQRLIEAGQTDQEIATELTLRALGRQPTPDELRLWCEGRERKARLEDMTWALLNSREFTTNH